MLIVFWKIIRIKHKHKHTNQDVRDPQLDIEQFSIWEFRNNIGIYKINKIIIIVIYNSKI